MTISCIRVKKEPNKTTHTQHAHTHTHMKADEIWINVNYTDDIFLIWNHTTIMQADKMYEAYIGPHFLQLYKDTIISKDQV